MEAVGNGSLFLLIKNLIDMELSIAERRQAKIKLGLQGP
jgi:hypothetical protein